MQRDGFEIYEGNNWDGLKTIKDCWTELYEKGIITYEIKEKMHQLSHVEQQEELEKYEGLYDV